jgi:XTP/dITP diphosphohydrolase
VAYCRETDSDRRAIEQGAPVYIGGMKLLIATTNKAKAEELLQIMSAPGLECLSLAAAEMPRSEEVEETGASFAENALLKARHYAALTKLVTVADDSGLEVEALGGKPGIRSARYAGPQATDADRIAKLLAELNETPDDRRQARFVCAAAVVWSGHERVFIGDVRGRILRAARGSSGFGYDPIFYYEPLGRTFGEMTREEKSEVSHRAKAFRQLGEWLRGLPEPDRLGRLGGALDTPLGRDRI